MKSSKVWRIVWIVGIYAILVCMLYLVVLYKVKWEHKDLNTYLYFYNCNGELCSSTSVLDDYYNKIICEDDACPYIDTIIDQNIILKRENSSWIYNYVTGKVINNDYSYYRYIGDNKYVVGDETNQYGVIDIDGNVLVTVKYNFIDDYKNHYISYKNSDGTYSILRTTDEYKINDNYEDIVLINDKIFAGRTNNIYQLYPYDNPDSDSSNKYDYIYSYKDVILVVNNKKIDILNNNLKSTLLMKIDSFYGYTTEKERESLEIHTDKNNIYFRVFLNETEYTEYMYNIVSKKLI